MSAHPERTPRLLGLPPASRRLMDGFAALRERDEAAFIPFFMAGDRGMGVTERLLDAAVSAGADAIELGVPFSDPMADGPVLQRAAERALASGSTLGRVLEMVVDFRRRSSIPVILFGYANPFCQYGPARLATAASAAGVDALLCVDMPPEEADQLRLPLRDAGIDMVFLLAPTSTRERIHRVLRTASGFVYFVSVTGVTGVKAIATDTIEPLVREIRAETRIPVGVGFGITSAAQVADVSRFSDAAIVGTQVARLIEDARDDEEAIHTVEAFLAECKQATRRAGAG